MKNTLKLTNVSVDPALQDYLDAKLADITKFVRSPEAEARVELSKITGHHKQGEIFRAEINLKLNGQMLRADATGHDLFEALDKVKDGLTGEVKHYYGKHDTLLRRGGRALKDLLRNRWSKKK